MANILEGIKNFMTLINENWTTIIIIIGLALLIYKKVKSYLKLNTQEKIDLALSGVSDIILELVTDAQTEYGTDTNKIKRSKVIAEIYTRFPILTKVIDRDSLIKKIDILIDDALKTMKEILETKTLKESNDTVVTTPAVESAETTDTTTE